MVAISESQVINSKISLPLLYHEGGMDLLDTRPRLSATPENVAFIRDIIIRKFLNISAFYTCLCNATQQLNHILMWWKLLHHVQLSQNILSIFVCGVICKHPFFGKDFVR